MSLFKLQSNTNSPSPTPINRTACSVGSLSVIPTSHTLFSKPFPLSALQLRTSAWASHHHGLHHQPQPKDPLRVWRCKSNRSPDQIYILLRTVPSPASAVKFPVIRLILFVRRRSTARASTRRAFCAVRLVLIGRLGVSRDLGVWQVCPVDLVAERRWPEGRVAFVDLALEGLRPELLEQHASVAHGFPLCKFNVSARALPGFESERQRVVTGILDWGAENCGSPVRALAPASHLQKGSRYSSCPRQTLSCGLA